VSLSSSLQQPNKLYSTIEVQPTAAKDLVDHYSFYVNENEQKRVLSPAELHFSAEGFAAGEQYEVCVVAHPKKDIVNVQPIESNQRVSRLHLIRLTHRCRLFVGIRSETRDCRWWTFSESLRFERSNVGYYGLGTHW
jgi:hypothetical protein